MQQFAAIVRTMVSSVMDEHYPDEASLQLDEHLRSFAAAFPRHFHKRFNSDGIFSRQDIVDLLTNSIFYVTGMHK